MPFFSAHLKRGGEQDRQRIRDFATPTTMYCGVVLPSRNIFLKDYEYWHSMSLLNWWDTDVRSRRSFSCIMKGEKNKAEHGPGLLLRVLQIGLANVILKLFFFCCCCCCCCWFVIVFWFERGGACNWEISFRYAKTSNDHFDFPPQQLNDLQSPGFIVVFLLQQVNDCLYL